MYPRGLNVLQKISMSLMGVLALLTFVAANLHALLWQSSEWLVSTVLPSVVVDLTNDERAHNDAAPLIRNATLDAAAKLKAEHMAKNQYFAHFSPDGVSPWHWFDEAGYVYAHAGENLAIHFTDSGEVVEAWMNSPTHRANIVDKKYTEIGVGTAKGTYDGYNTVYVVQLFGAPAVPPPATKPPVQRPEVTETQIAEVTPVEEVVPVLVAAEEGSVETATSAVLAVAEVETEPVVTERAVIPATPAAEVQEESAEVAVVPENTFAVTEDEPIVSFSPEDTVIVETTLIATSSGLAVASISTEPVNHAGATLASIATKPNELLQIAYMTLGALVLFLLTISVVVEARRLHFMQVAYGVFLIIGMGGLWFIHTWLTSGATIV